MSVGKTIKLFLADGTAGGLITAEILNWTGHVVSAPRSNLSELIDRPEMSRTGIYFLLGDDPESFGGTLAYIGEADEVGRRLYQHGRVEEKGGKDFWDRAIVVTSKDFNLTKAHARWLESRVIGIATEARRCKLMNGTAPPLIQLPEADVSDMEFFTQQVQLILPVLGENLLRSSSVMMAHDDIGGATTSDSKSPIFELNPRSEGVYATGQEVGGEFTVFEGSTARRHWFGTDRSYIRTREQVEQEGSLVPSPAGDLMVFIRNVHFKAPSAAAAVVLGRNANGRKEWKIKNTSTTYAEWQERQIERVEGADYSGETPV